MSKKVAIDALTRELTVIEEEIGELRGEAAIIARALSTLTGRDAGNGQVSIRASSYPKGNDRRPGAESQAGKVLAFIEANGPVTMGEIMRAYYGVLMPESGSKEWNKIGIYPGTLIRKGLVVKTRDGKYQGVGAPSAQAVAVDTVDKVTAEV